MEEKEIRLECVKLAEKLISSLVDNRSYTLNDPGMTVLAQANAFYLFVANGTVPDGKTPTSATGAADGGASAG
jgi:hypothetical protein